MMANWVPAYEGYHKSLSRPLKEQLLLMSSATLDRMLAPLRAREMSRSIPTRPGTMLRQEIPIRGGAWQESQAGWLEADTVSLSGGGRRGSDLDARQHEHLYDVGRDESYVWARPTLGSGAIGCN